MSYRTHKCGKIDSKLAGTEVEVVGWVNKRRDHGGVIFFDLRDESGVVQVVFDRDNKENFSLAESCRNEFVLYAKGLVRERPTGTINPELETGKVEIIGSDLLILNDSIPAPFQLDEYASVGEDTRLKFRFLDLRRAEMQKNIRLRSSTSMVIRNFLDKNEFVEIETPLLTKATPEGARDYLVPSRTYPGSFFALPQSPQLFKQTLMASGFEKYYQFARCFRDEDLRADRQPEFTQIDLECSFVTAENIRELVTNLISRIFQEVMKVELGNFLTLTYSDAIERFGTDKPDLRNPLELLEIKDLFKNTEFKVFREAADSKESRIACLSVAGSEEFTRKKIDEYTEFVGKFGAKGLAYIKVDDPKKGKEGLQSPIVKFLEDEIYKHLDWSRDELSKYIDCNKEDIVYFPNPSTALNTVIKSLDLNEGDEVLTTNHEYGAMDRTWKFVSRKRGFKYINLAIDLPILNETDFINQFSSAINLNTKVIFISHITSPTGIIFPVKKLSELARKNNIIMIIDGAHAPAQIDLSIKDIKCYQPT